MNALKRIEDLEKEIKRLKRRLTVGAGGVPPSAHGGSHTTGSDALDPDALSDLLDGAADPFLRTSLAGGGGAHASSHQNGGGDEIDVTGLSGVLADPQVASSLGELLDFVFIRKTSDESLNTNATLQADNELVLPIGANETWLFEFHVVYLGNTTGDFKCGLTFPTSPTEISYYISGLDTSAANAGANVAGSLSLIHAVADAVGGAGRGADTNKAVVVLRGFVRNGSNAGNVTLMWAQNTSNGTNTTVKAGSWLEGRRRAA